MPLILLILPTITPRQSQQSDSVKFLPLIIATLRTSILSSASKHSKSPLILSAILGFLIISTLVVASSYFLRPNMESELKRQLGNELLLSGIDNTVIDISGRDVTLNGLVNSKAEANKVEKIAREIWGIRDVNNHLVIINQAVE